MQVSPSHVILRRFRHFILSPTLHMTLILCVFSSFITPHLLVRSFVLQHMSTLKRPSSSSSQFNLTALLYSGGPFNQQQQQGVKQRQQLLAGPGEESGNTFLFSMMYQPLRCRSDESVIPFEPYVPRYAKWKHNLMTKEEGEDDVRNSQHGSHSTCIGWRQTRHCNTNVISPLYDRSCNAKISDGARGYCLCTGSVKIGQRRCGQRALENFTCHELCDASSRFFRKKELPTRLMKQQANVKKHS